MNLFTHDGSPMARGRAVSSTAVAVVVALLLVESPWMPSPIRVLATAVLLVLPGYWCSRIMFPGRAIGSVERVTATIALSFATTMLLTLGLDIMSITLTRASWGLTVAAAAVAVAWWGAAVIEPQDRGGRPPLARLGRIHRRPRDLVLVALLLAVLVATAVLARTPLAPPHGVAGYTQLWLVPNGQGHELGVASFELHAASYHLDLLADDVVVGQWDVALEPGQRWTTVIAPTLGQPSAVLHGRLYKDGGPQPYRTVDVRSSPASAP